MKKGSPADRSGSVPKYSNPRQKSPGDSPYGPKMSRKNPNGGGKSVAAIFNHAHAHSSKTGSPHNKNGNSNAR